MIGREYKNAANNQAEAPIFTLSNDVKRNITYPSFIALQVMGKFATTCQRAEAETALPRILHCAAFALPESWQQEDKTKLAAIAMLKTHPHLLFQKGFTRLPSGQLVYGSPYQVFLGSGDIWAPKTIHDEIIPHIDGGEAKALEQYIEQFPNPGCALASFTQEDLIALKTLMEQADEQVSDDLRSKVLSINDNDDVHQKVLFEKQEFVEIHQLLSEMKREDLCAKLCEAEMLHDDRNKEQIAKLREDLIEIVAAISEDPCTNGKATQERTVNAIRALREHLAPRKGAIRTGLYSPPEIMKIIHEVYDQNFDPWDGNRLSLYSFEVIGGAECAASAVDAQCYKKGLCNFKVDAAPDRTLSYFSGPSRCSGLGSSSFVDVYYGGWRVSFAERGSVVAVWSVSAFGKFLSSKNTELAKPILLHQKPRREEKTSRCVIC